MGIVDEKKLVLNSSVGRPTLDTVLERVPVEIQSQLGEENEVAWILFSEEIPVRNFRNQLVDAIFNLFFSLLYRYGHM